MTDGVSALVVGLVVVWLVGTMTVSILTCWFIQDIRDALRGAKPIAPHKRMERVRELEGALGHAARLRWFVMRHGQAVAAFHNGADADEWARTRGGEVVARGSL